MMKPKNWMNVPAVILETFLWDLELDYDPYESSKPETIHYILSNPDGASTYNQGLISGHWNAMSEIEFQRRVKNEMDKLKNQIENLETYLQK